MSFFSCFYLIINRFVEVSFYEFNKLFRFFVNSLIDDARNREVACIGEQAKGEPTVAWGNNVGVHFLGFLTINNQRLLQTRSIREDKRKLEAFFSNESS